MSFNDSAQLDTSQVESGSRGGGGGGGFPGGIQVGGGIGGLILLILTLIFGGNVLGGGDSGGSSSSGLPSQQLESDQVSAAGQVPDASIAACKTGGVVVIPSGNYNLENWVALKNGKAWALQLDGVITRTGTEEGNMIFIEHT